MLTEASLHAGVDELSRREPVFAAVVERHGMPVLWDREPGFPSLLHIMLEQQVSLASARAVFDRLRAQAGPLTPESLLALDDQQLRAVGFSRQKTRYARAAATAVLEGTLNLDELATLDDAEVDRQLQALPGIGPWTSTIYRLSVLGRPDAWPAGDLAVIAAIAELWQLPALPSPAETTLRAEPWRPWRAVAARILWQHYLGRLKPGGTPPVSRPEPSPDRPA
ncbi:3-methyladenine DNA glycosylase [Paractinoplanes abujensis]|uniref:DNA-3-methyladenine glycosylase II n=1 Tax=Paractinoplanes abujensis TaxID=882441 RepID=A0A7W7CS62_9ACTN|nr:DNA-3-methyladenine glycosylase 2 family protein [Actinoplanes abujensis]MBB4693692.1 DNA-3-methyladenine glycosylase II [Actinoplanes abujensis]GID21651.1 3-methyladenine DNA glycosylase [Actinoplanes abujensis]